MRNDRCKIANDSQGFGKNILNELRASKGATSKEKLMIMEKIWHKKTQLLKILGRIILEEFQTNFAQNRLEKE